MQNRALSWLGFVLLAVAACGAAERPAERVSAEDVRKAIEKGRRALFERLERHRGQDHGFRILGIMALLNCGVPANDPALAAEIDKVAKTIEPVCAEQYHGTYRAGLMLMLLAMLKNPAHDKLAARLSATLQRHQNPAFRMGANDHRRGGWGDNSRAQFALLGLKAAEDLGLAVEPGVYKLAREYITAGQNADGGWSYWPNSGSSYGRMTVAGVTSLYVCGMRLNRGVKVCGEIQADRSLVKGLEWLSQHFSVTGNPGRCVDGGIIDHQEHYYYLYGMERVGVLLAQQSIGGRDWYREGAAVLVRAQAADGTWGPERLATEFAMLFLGKGSAPIAVQKLRHGREWNPDPYDARALVENAARELKTPMGWQVADTDASAEDLAAAPILYLQGHRALNLDAAFLTRLKAFVDHGGFVFASACCGEESFAASFREIMLKLYPDARFELLPAAHPVYNLKHRIEAKHAFMLEGLNTGCRTSVFLAPRDVCCAWGGCEGCKDTACVRDQEARNLGVNFIAYAIGFNRLKDKLDKVEWNLQGTAARVGRGALVIGQLYHGGDWDPDPVSIPNLAQTLREQTGMKGGVAKRRVVLGTDDPGEYPLLYITGHKAFAFTPGQLKILRGYLDKGGVLFADPCCGKTDFDLAFRKLCEQLYPGHELQRLPRAHAVFQTPFKLETVDYKVGVKRFFPELKNEPHLEGIAVQDRLRVIYSRFNLGCEWQGHACGGCLSLEPASAYKVAVNVILYALNR